ncbi:MAG: DUF4105 domain-containing protein [Planctomycetales bacterium]|nr:DUF4105 domain-containing protein [Planctomycetales bacterium]
MARGLALVGLLLGLVSGCRTMPRNDLSDVILPSNYREWSPEFSVLPTAEFDGDRVILRNVRNASYVTETNYILEYETREYRLSKLEHVDFFLVPFKGMEFIAHTMISFGFAGGEYVAVSAEIRTEKGEAYSPASGLARQFELTYVVADERDVVRLRTRHRDADVYLYRTVATPEQSEQLFRDVMGRVNELAEHPEFYNTLTNNCTTNIVSHVNRIAPHKVPYNIGVLLPGYSDREAYDLGLLDQSVPFRDLKRQARINDLADAFYDDPDFSTKIRRRVLEPDRTEFLPLAPHADEFDGQPNGVDLLGRLSRRGAPSLARYSTSEFEDSNEGYGVRQASALEPIPLNEQGRNPLDMRSPAAPPSRSRQSLFGIIPSQRDQR